MTNRIFVSPLPKVIATLLLTAVLAACSGANTGGDNEGEPHVIGLLQVDNLKTFSFPLDSYVYSPLAMPSYSRAFGTLYRRCMADFGFTLPPAPPRRPETFSLHERRYGVTDEDEVKVLGYRPPKRESGRPTPSPRPESPAEIAVSTGDGPRTHQGQPIPEGGCAGEARRQIEAGAPPAEDLRLGETLANESFARAAEDSRVRAVTDAWSQCMTRAGYDYATPHNSGGDPAWATPDPTPREIAVAVADARCKKETNYINIRASVETAYQQRALERNVQGLELVRRSLETQERNAAKVIASG